MKLALLLTLLVVSISPLSNADPFVSSKTNLVTGEKFTVTWSSSNIIAGDWVILVPTSTPLVVSTALSFVEATSVARQTTFTAPREAGTYEIRYVRQQSPNVELYNTLVQLPVSVYTHASDTFLLTVSRLEASPRQAVEVKWYPDTGNTTYNDSIALISAGHTNLPQDALYWTAARRWFNNNEETYYITEPGSYQFVYARESPPKSNAYRILAVSDTVVIRPSITDTATIRNFPAPGKNAVVAFGDSLTAGIGATDSEAGFVPELALRTACSVSSIINAGKSGDTTGDALKRLESDVLIHDPKIVVIMLGGNNIFRRVSDATTYTELRAIVDRIHDNGSMVVLVGLQGGNYATRLVPLYERISRETGCAYVPNILHGIIGTTRLMSDLVHPDNGGYGIMARRVAPVVQQLLGVRTTPTLYVKHSEHDSSARVTVGLVPSLSYTLYTSPDFGTWKPFITFDGNNAITVETTGASNAAFFHIGPTTVPSDPMGTGAASEFETPEDENLSPP